LGMLEGNLFVMFVANIFILLINYY